VKKREEIHRRLRQTRPFRISVFKYLTRLKHNANYWQVYTVLARLLSNAYRNIAFQPHDAGKTTTTNVSCSTRRVAQDRRGDDAQPRWTGMEARARARIPTITSAAEPPVSGKGWMQVPPSIASTSLHPGATWTSHRVGRSMRVLDGACMCIARWWCAQQSELCGSG